MRLNLIIFGLLLLAGSNAFSNETEGGNPYGLTNNQTVQATLTMTGNVVHTPLELFPPNPEAEALHLGAINPGQTRIFATEPGYESENFRIGCGVKGTIGYNVHININMELEKDGVQIEPKWEISPKLMGGGYVIMPYTYPANSLEYNQTIGATKGLFVRSTILRLTALPGAPVGERLFKFTLKFEYHEI